MPALRSTRTAAEKRTPRKTARSTRGAVDTSEEPELLSVQEIEQPDYEGVGNEEEDEGEEEEEEEDAETRCICGEMDPPDADGLFIQCEKCSVWQHGFCVSISVNVPEKYWCEQCRPELHSITVKSGEKKSKYLPVQPKEPTRKPNRRSAAAAAAAAAASHVDDNGAANNSNLSKGSNTPTEDELESSATSKRNRRERATQDARYEAMVQRVMEESKKEASHSDAKSEDEGGERSTSTRSSRSRRRKHEDAEDEDDNDEGEAEGNYTRDTSYSKEAGDYTIDGDASSFRDSRISKLKKDSTENDSSAPESQSNKPTKAKKQKRSKNVNRSPQKEKDSSIDFNKPTKPRLPQQRATVNEMRRRVAAILEFIGRTQVDIASEQSDKDEMTKFVDDDVSKARIEALFENYSGSLEQMDSLTRKLLVWEQKFGKYGDR